MQISISTRHGQLSPSTQEKISEKILKLTRFHDRLSSAQATVELKGEERAALEIQITAEKAGRFVAASEADNVMAALDVVIHKLEQQLKKHKEKITDHRTPVRRIEPEPEPEPE